MIITQTPEPIEISETRVYMDRGLTMATFGLMDGANQNRQKKLLQLPDSLRVALLLKDGSVIEALAGKPYTPSLWMNGAGSASAVRAGL